VLRTSAPLIGALGVSLNKSWNSASGVTIDVLAASKAQRPESMQRSRKHEPPR